MALVLDGTNGETFPSWTTATRPSSPAVGQMGYNTTIGQFDCYTSGGWVSVATTTSTSNKITASQMPTGSVIQTFIKNFSTADVVTTTGIANYSSALPTSSQGSQIYSTSFTPISSTSTLLFSFNGYYNSSIVQNVIIWILEGSTVIGVIAPRVVTTGEATFACLLQTSKASNGTQTYSLRFGVQNGGNASFLYYPAYSGGVQSVFTIQEIA